jgi:hypothetical protein
MTSTLSRQRPLPLVINQRTVLVDVQTVRAARCVDAESVFALVDNGDLQWVFDMATDGPGGAQRRELRFWTREIIAPETTASLSIAQVIKSILGEKKIFHSGEIEQQWVLCQQSIMRLRQSGDFAGGKGSLTRDSLETFLIKRWCGTAVARNGGNL